MNAWTDCCLCVCVSVYVYVVGWFGRLASRVEQSTLLPDKEPLRIAVSLQILHLVESV